MTQPMVSSQLGTAGGLKLEHYPSLELCKKLTAIGFPKTTEKVMVYKQLREDYGSHIEDRNGQHTNGSESRIVCPSVMELLDEMPTELEYENGTLSYLWMSKDRGVGYNGFHIVDYSTLPNALAEMWLWLKENKYI